jgi:ribonuclease VapC
LIVIDSSAIVALLRSEPDGPRFVQSIRHADRALMSAVNVHESGMVLRVRLGPGGPEDLYDLLGALAVEVLPFEVVDVRLALRAFERYGKGLHSKARLNLCDCAAYALAKRLGAPLLFKGADFVHTDIPAVRLA